MNNKQKFEQLVTQISQLKKRYQEEDLKSIRSIRKRNSLEEKILVLKGLEFSDEKPIFSFNSTRYGLFCTQMNWNSRKRIRAVPICFFVTLYEHELKRMFPKEDIQIPYTLKGFWAIRQANKFVEEFIHLQNGCQSMLLWESRTMSKENAAKVKAYGEILNEFAKLRILTGAWEYKISYETEDLAFKINKKNMKLNVVPLCRLLTLYYARVSDKIHNYVERYSTKREEETLERVRNSLWDFMEKYFAEKTF